MSNDVARSKRNSSPMGERVAALEATQRAHARELKELKDTNQSIDERLQAITRLGFGVLGGLLVNMLLFVLALMRDSGTPV